MYELSASERLWLVAELKRRERPELALQVLDSFPRLSRRLRVEHALLLIWAGRLDDAAAAIAANFPHESSLLSRLGMAHEELGDYHRALELFNAAIDALPQATIDCPPESILVMRSFAYRRLGRHREALEDLKKALAFETDPEKRVLLHLSKGELWVKMGELEEAESEARRGLGLRPNDLLLQLLLARAVPTEANRQHAARAAVSAEDPKGHFLRGLWRHNLGLVGEAVQDLVHAEALGVEDPLLFLVRSLCYDELDRSDESLRDFQRYQTSAREQNAIEHLTFLQDPEWALRTLNTGP